MVHIENMLGLYEQKQLQPTFCFYLHPWEFHEMPQGPIHFGEGSVIPNPFFVKNCGEVALAQLDRLLTELQDREFRFLSARDLAKEY